MHKSSVPSVRISAHVAVRPSNGACRIIDRDHVEDFRDDPAFEFQPPTSRASFQSRCRRLACLRPSRVRAHRAQDVVRAEALSIDVDHQNFHRIPAFLPQRFELFGAGFDRLPADRTARHPHRFRHLRQHFLILSRRNAAQQCTQQVLAETAVLSQGFVGRYLHFAFGLVAQPGSFHFYLPVGQLDLTRLRPMPADIPAGLARRAGSGDLFRAQHQDGLQSLYLDFVNHVLHDLASAFDEVDQRQQDLFVGLAELLDDGGRFAWGARHNMVGFLHGGWLLFKGLVWQTDSVETGATQLRLGHPRTVTLESLE